MEERGGGAGGGAAPASDACCSTGNNNNDADADPRDSAAAHLSARASRLERELEDDPTLQDCCRRDLEQEARASRRQAALSRVDRASRAELARKLGGAVAPPPRPRPRPPPHKALRAERGDGGGAKALDWRLKQKIRKK